MSHKKFAICTIALTLAALLFFAVTTVIIDPLFHYHAPLDSLSYAMDDERHQNDGITRQFEYDAIITGTSMAENFKASEFNELFGVNAIKTCYNGGSFKEINNGLERAFSYNPDIKCVFRIVDSTNFPWDKDHMRDGSFPEYLYDDNIINDVNYIFNFEVFHDFVLRTLRNTVSGMKPVSFDTYSSWSTANTGKEVIDKNRDRNDMDVWYSYDSSSSDFTYNEKTEQAIIANLDQNIISLAKAQPDTDFYMVLPPYNIYFYDTSNLNGALQYHFDCQEKAVEMLLEVPNIHLFAYLDKYDVTCNFDNFIDSVHYADFINSEILKWVAAGEGKLTKDNYKEYLENIRDFYTAYDYESLYK